MLNMLILIVLHINVLLVKHNPSQILVHVHSNILVALHIPVDVRPNVQPLYTSTVRVNNVGH